MAEEEYIPIDRIVARIKSCYYMKDELDQNKKFSDSAEAYAALKKYVLQHKADDDIIITNDKKMQILINVQNRTLPLDRFVKIDKNKIDIDNLTNNI